MIYAADVTHLQQQDIHAGFVWGSLVSGPPSLVLSVFKKPVQPNSYSTFRDPVWRWLSFWGLTAL